MASWVNPFTDVKSSAWYYEAAAFVNSNGLMNGQTDTTFGSQTAMTRGMFVTILGRMEGVDTAMYAHGHEHYCFTSPWGYLVKVTICKMNCPFTYRTLTFELQVVHHHDCHLLPGYGTKNAINLVSG